MEAVEELAPIVEVLSLKFNMNGLWGGCGVVRDGEVWWRCYTRERKKGCKRIVWWRAVRVVVVAGAVHVLGGVKF